MIGAFLGQSLFRAPNLSRYIKYVNRLAEGSAGTAWEQAGDGGHSHILTWLFHKSREKLSITRGLREPSLCGTHWINVVQSSGFGYKQFSAPLQPVAAILAFEHVNPSAGVTNCGDGLGFKVIMGSFVVKTRFDSQVDSSGSTHSLSSSFHSRLEGQGIW